MKSLDYALKYAARGWRVFPVYECRATGTQCSCGSKKCTSPGKHPRTKTGLKEATLDAAVIRAWWRQWPNANIGIATGNGLVVVDIDPRHGGAETIDALRAELGAWPDTVEALTGGGGRHIYLAPPAGVVIRNSAAELGAGVDIRGDGGYVVAPPSNHVVAGGTYRWEASSDPTDGVVVAEMPAAWVARVAKPKREPTATGTVTPAEATVPEGGRNKALFSLGRSLRAKGLPESTILAALTAHNTAACVPPLDSDEVESIVTSACSVPAGPSPEYAAKMRPLKATPNPADLAGMLAECKATPDCCDDEAFHARAALLSTGQLAELKAAMKSADVPLRGFNAAVAVIKREADRERRRTAAAERLAAVTRSRTRINVGPDEDRVADEAVAALISHPDVYQRGGALVYVLTDQSPLRGVTRPAGAPRIAPLPLPTLREYLANVAVWVVDSPDGPKAGTVPVTAVQAVAARGQWRGIRALEAIVDCPVLRPDGSVIDAVGYDPMTGLLYAPTRAFPAVPSAPSMDDARVARELLEDVFIDFPFRTAADRSGALAAVLTPLAQWAYGGAVPFFLIDANTPGAGKGLLANIVGEIATGRPLPVMAPLPDADEAEARKRITSLAFAGERCVLVDNIVGTIGGTSLDAALTAPGEWSDRLLGTNITIKVPLALVWYGTGNNVAIKGDGARRFLRIRLESPEERPEERVVFKHADLVAYVRGARDELVVAALTVLRAYCLAGRPSMKLAAWGGFSGWSDLIRGALVWSGAVDPGDTREALRASASSTTEALRVVVAGWVQLAEGNPYGCTAVQAAAALASAPGDWAEFIGAIGELGGQCPPGRTPDARAIGGVLRRIQGRVVSVGGALRAMVGGTKGNQGVRWVAARSDAGDSSDSIPSHPNPRGGEYLGEGGENYIDPVERLVRNESPESPASLSTPSRPSPWEELGPQW